MRTDLKKKVNSVCCSLERKFGTDTNTLPKDNLLGLVVHTIISQNTTDLNRNRAYEALRERYPSDAELLAAPRTMIESSIRVAGLAKQKSGAITALFKWVKESGASPDLRDLSPMSNETIFSTLCAIKGIGIKTVSIILCFGLGRDVFPVDTHVNRTCARIGFVPEKSTPDKTHRLMTELIPKGKALSFHMNLIKLGKTICLARKPKCPLCPLKKTCRFCQSV